MIKVSSWIVFYLILSSCTSIGKNELNLVLTNDELVRALVDMYTLNAALNINDASFRDSTSTIYYKKVAENLGVSSEIIKSDIEKLRAMPDSLLMIQGRALDTLRSLTEKNYSTSTISIGIN